MSKRTGEMVNFGSSSKKIQRVFPQYKEVEVSNNQIH